MWRNLSGAATFLGMHISSLCEWGKKEALYAPTIRGIPHEGHSGIRGLQVGARHVRYHPNHLKIILAVFVGEMSLEDGTALWKKRKKVFLKEALDFAPEAKTRKPRRKTNGASKPTA